MSFVPFIRFPSQKGQVLELKIWYISTMPQHKTSGTVCRIMQYMLLFSYVSSGDKSNLASSALPSAPQPLLTQTLFLTQPFVRLVLESSPGGFGLNRQPVCTRVRPLTALSYSCFSHTCCGDREKERFIGLTFPGKLVFAIVATPVPRINTLPHWARPSCLSPEHLVPNSICILSWAPNCIAPSPFLPLPAETPIDQ